MKEEWKEITLKRCGYESILNVSNTGRIIIPDKWIKARNNSQRFRPEREAKYSSLKSGYIRGAGVLVHRIVAELFVEKPKEWTPKWDVNHKDLDKSNNNSSNLEWITHKENCEHYLASDKAIGQVLHPVEVTD